MLSSRKVSTGNKQMQPSVYSWLLIATEIDVYN